MVKVLFVCHGNICRSPMGEYMLRDMVKKLGVQAQFEIASAAVSTEELGNPMYPPARRELKKHGIDGSGHAARQITVHDLAYYDRIYYMDASNRRRLERLFGTKAEKCRPLLSRDVADPWYTGDFEATWRDLEEGCKMILKECGIC